MSADIWSVLLHASDVYEELGYSEKSDSMEFGLFFFVDLVLFSYRSDGSHHKRWQANILVLIFQGKLDYGPD